MLQSDSLDGFPRNPERRLDHQKGHARGRDRLGSRVPVRMLLVGWPLRNSKSKKDDCGREHVTKRVDGVGQKRKGIAHQPTRELGQPKTEIDDKPEQSGSAGIRYKSDTGLFATGK